MQTTIPDEHAYPATWRKTVISFGLALGLLALGNGLASRFGTNSGFNMVNHKWLDLMAMERPVDWFVLGDSFGLYGVMPSVMEQRLGGECLNFASHAGLLMFGNSQMLDVHIQRIGPPKQVIIVTAPTTWQKPIEEGVPQTMSKTPLPWGFWRELEPGFSFSPARWWEMVLGRYVPLYSSNTTIGALVQSLPARLLPQRASGAEATPEAPPLPPDLQAPEADVEKGWKAGDIRTVEEVLKTAKWLEPKTDNGFSVSAINRRVVESVARMAVEHHFEVYFANGPVMQQAVDRSPQVRRFLESLDHELPAWLESFPNCHYIRGTLLLPPTCCMDYGHVNPRGARAYSAALAAAVERLREDPSRPVTLRSEDVPGVPTAILTAPR